MMLAIEAPGFLAFLGKSSVRAITAAVSLATNIRGVFAAAPLAFSEH
jgi:hypothetical protein